MPTSVPMMPDAGVLAGENLLYIIQGSGTDRDRKVTLAELREYCTAQGVALYELNTASASNLVLPLALGPASTSAFVVVSGTGRNTYTLNISGSVPDGCQVNVLMMASGALKLAATGATINGIDSGLTLSLGDSALLGRGTGTVWWGSATRSAANTDAAVLAETQRAEGVETSFSQSLSSEANTRSEADSALGLRIDNEAAACAGITAKAVIVDMKDADGTTGVLNFDASAYKCDVHLLVVNTTSVTPPSSPGYFTLTIGSALPAGCTLHITGAFSGSSWTTGATLPVRVHFTNSYSQGLGELLYPYPDWVPLLAHGHFSAIVMYDDLTWYTDTTDLIAMSAYNKVAPISTFIRKHFSSGTEFPIANVWQEISEANVDLTAGHWLALLQLEVQVAWTSGNAGSADGELGLLIAIQDDNMEEPGRRAQGLHVSVSSQLTPLVFTKNLITDFVLTTPVNQYSVNIRTATGAFTDTALTIAGGQVIYRRLA